MEKNIGVRIRQYRKQKGLTLEQLAKLIGFAKSYLSKIENGVVDAPLDTLNKIALGIGVPLEDLLDIEVDTGSLERVSKFSVYKAPGENTTSSVFLKKFGYYPIMQDDEQNRRRLSVILFRVNSHEQLATTLSVGDEFGFVIEGSVCLVCNDNKTTVSAGDTFYVAADTEYYLLNDSETVCTGFIAANNDKGE